ncbi:MULTISPECIES: recombinase family protein [unclassified Mesorhizobium]|uniref:recombinase family protein n=1 Tax=unclassified Mesorhizobium TaxID=325217 RepID=UPI000FC9C299|nr:MULTISPECIES: recombinase family protein [unclassified Mesorhizobium]RUW74819.1 recombinase family protein [Mesorhizobium sp. M4B.F.Ca.ET.049.02.1.2]TGV23237.1 recombinase family protein [Mesorhizobium sp. M4B.F.Ca.ET.143.01.1.1]
MDSNASKPSAYSYVRMSTDIQLKGDSLRRQEQASKLYAEQNDLQLVEDFKLEDIGVSAFKGANVVSGALGKFLTLIKSGGVPKGSYLLVESLDRISRQQIMDSLTVFFDIIRNGVSVVTLADSHVYRAGEAEITDILYSLIILSRAYEESATKSLRVGEAWRNKRDNASHKKLTKMAPAWVQLREDRSTFDLIPEKAEIVRQIFQMADAGHGSFAIARRLNQTGVPTFTKSNGWHESYVTKILRSRAALGEFQPHRYDDKGKRIPSGDPVADYFPGLVDEDQFLRIQASRRRRLVEGAGRKGPEYRNLFTKIAKCHYCGEPMRFVHKGRPPKGSQALKCTNAVRNLGCESTSWRYSDFETSFLFFVKEIDLTATLRAATDNSERQTIEQKIAANEEKLHQLRDKQEATFELVSSPGPSAAFLKTKLDQIADEIVGIEQQLVKLKNQLADTQLLPSISAFELRSQIDSLQDMSAPDIFDRRAAVANRLKSIVTSLRVAANGSRPRLKTIADALGDQGIDEEYREKLLAHIDHVNAVTQSYSRTFTVTLADGVQRLVVVKGDDPTDFVSEVVIEANGKTTGSILGKPLGYPPVTTS